MRAVIYARYSTDLQSASSIDDQVRLCRERIERDGHELVQVYKDRAMSGATLMRPGIQALMQDIHDFDFLYAEALDRLSRDQEDIAGLFKRMRYSDVSIITLAESEISELHVGLKGTMNALFLKDLADKTRRGLRGRVEAGRSGGGRSYGYDVVRTYDEDGCDNRGLRRVNEAEASIVRRIFEAFRAGKSPRAIARELNAKGIPGPNGRQWRDTTIRGHAMRRTGLLRNDLYAGRLIWSKQRYDRDPMTGKRVARPNPPEHWVIREVPELRIVDAELWQAVQDRLDNIRASDLSRKIQKTEFWKRRRPRHLLTGLICCAECGNNMSAVGSDYLACARARNNAGCGNTKGVKRSKIEKAVLEGLKSRLMAPDLVEEFVQAFHDEVNRHRHEQELGRRHLERELRDLGKKLEGLYDAIAEGLRTDGLKAKLEELEERQRQVKEQLKEPSKLEPRLHPRLASLYRQKVADLHAALSDPDTKAEAAEILRGLIERIDVRSVAGGHVVELIGDIVKLVSLPTGGDVPASFESSVKVVAGVGFEPTTFRL